MDMVDGCGARERISEADGSGGGGGVMGVTQTLETTARWADPGASDEQRVAEAARKKTRRGRESHAEGLRAGAELGMTEEEEARRKADDDAGFSGPMLRGFQDGGVRAHERRGRRRRRALAGIDVGEDAGGVAGGRRRERRKVRGKACAESVGRLLTDRISSQRNTRSCNFPGRLLDRRTNQNAPFPANIATNRANFVVTHV